MVYSYNKEKSIRLAMLRERTFRQLLIANSEAKSEAITQERRILRLEQDFSAMAWHELKNPLSCLAAALSYTHSALSNKASSLEATNKQLCTMADILQHTADCMVTLEVKGSNDTGSTDTASVDGAHCGSTMQKSNALLRMQKQDLVELLRGVVEFVTPQLSSEAGHVALEVVLPDAPLWVMVDTKLVRQVVLNLLSNAIRLTESGFVRLRCEVRPANEVGSEETKVGVLIEVADSGPGLPPERMQQLTQRYGSSVGGTGLGLHTVGRLLSCLGSELDAQSPYAGGKGCGGKGKLTGHGPGTALSFVLQLERAAPEVVRQLNASEASKLPDELQVLIADDIAMNRKLLKLTLKKIQPGWTVAQASTAEEALELVRSSSFGLVFMDEDFSFGGVSEKGPLMLGSDAVRLIREHEKATGVSSPVVIISVTGHSGQKYDAYLLACGVDSVWSKPLPNHLDGTMQRLLTRVLAMDRKRPLAHTLAPVPPWVPKVELSPPSKRRRPDFPSWLDDELLVQRCSWRAGTSTRGRTRSVLRFKNPQLELQFYFHQLASLYPVWCATGLGWSVVSVCRNLQSLLLMSPPFPSWASILDVLSICFNLSGLLVFGLPRRSSLWLSAAGAKPHTSSYSLGSSFHSSHSSTLFEWYILVRHVFTVVMAWRNNAWPQIPYFLTMQVDLLAQVYRTCFSWRIIVVNCVSHLGILGIEAYVHYTSSQVNSSPSYPLVQLALQILLVHLVFGIWMGCQHSERRQRQGFYRELQLQQLIRQMNEEKEVSVNRERVIQHLERDFKMAVRHALRNPLNGVACQLRNMQEMLAQHGGDSMAAVGAALPEALLAPLNEAKACLATALDFLESLGFLYKLDAAGVVPSYVGEDLVRLLRDAVEFVTPQLSSEAGHVALEVVLPDAPLWVMVDTKLVRQVVLNLLSNAIRLTESGFVRLRCEVRPANEVGSEETKVGVLIEVADSGPGLPPERMQQLTQRYGSSVGGTGLGLHTVGRLLSCLGSELDAQSPYAGGKGCGGKGKLTGHGPGTALSFVLQLERAAPEVVRQLNASEASKLPDELQVLIADDIAMNRKLLKLTLKKIQPGWTVAQASTAEEALELVRSSSFGLVFMDEDFSFGGVSEKGPLMLGSDAVRLIREHEKATGVSSPVVIISITASAHQLVDGADAVWGKPMPNLEDGSMRRQLQRSLCSGTGHRASCT